MKTLSVVAGLLIFIGFIPYILSIFGRDIRLKKIKPTKPSKVSWIIWWGLDFITLAAMFSANTVNGQIVAAVIGATVVIILSLKYGVPGWTRLDRFCLAGAVFSIILWQTFSSPELGILTSCIAMLIGSFPTFVSAWKNPAHEDKLAWTIFCISSVCAVIAAPHWTIADAAQPTMFLLIEGIIVYPLYFRVR